MGYTTDFEGSFKLNKQLTKKQSDELHVFSETRHEGPTDVGIGIWCDWVPTTDRKGICWNGTEKFYNYVEWLRYVISKFLQPWGLTLNGQVEWQGEDSDDKGLIVVTNNVVKTFRGTTVYGAPEEN